MPSIEVHTRGPLFDGRAPHIVDGVIGNTVRKVTEMGNERLHEMLRPRPAGVYLSVQQAGKRASKGHYAAQVQPTVSGLHGRIDDGNALYGPWLEGTGSRNQTTRFKGYASFRRTSQWMQQQVPGELEKAARELGRRLG